MKFSLESENTLRYKLLRYFKKNNNNTSIRQSFNLVQDLRIDEGFQQQKINNTSCPSLITTSTYLSTSSSSDQLKSIGILITVGQEILA